MSTHDTQPTVVSTEADVASYERDYPGRSGAHQLEPEVFRIGMTFLPLFVELGGLRPSHDVLDVGCGAGRMASALTGYLDGGTYEGFDTIEGLVRWAQDSISASFPAFRFRHVPLLNSAYNPDGTISPENFIFPFPDTSFDFAILTSVFTHMRGREVRHYLQELRRVLRPGGRVFATWFLLDEETDAAIQSGRALFALRHPVEDGYTHMPEKPESAIGFRRDDVLHWVRASRLVTVGLYEGSWRGRPSHATGQDVIVAAKP